ncbi:TELO2-interacting protein 1 homolog isoform X2 [Syngnathoides biaculeatus]|uniref:TELO2-interacting protein 1 homolog isoform X2 n=1 Tax=Syngnathoides biaculeatus TaxID=300417 RepID=UPI002ADE2924|nr:TELO2-interacting protein 1 homolog isoform X2 [Syngnathoides biaculeatus]
MAPSRVSSSIVSVHTGQDGNNRHPAFGQTVPESAQFKVEMSSNTTIRLLTVAVMPPTMALISDPKIAFAYLRPACVLLIREATFNNVETLNAQLKEVDDATLQQLQEYILFPLRFVLKVPGPKKDKLVQAVVEAMNHVLGNTCIQSWQILRELFSELFLCLCSPDNPGKPADTSEELKLAVLGGLDALLHAAYGDIVFKFFESKMLPELGAGISLLLTLAEKEKSRHVQRSGRLLGMLWLHSYPELQWRLPGSLQEMSDKATESQLGPSRFGPRLLASSWKMLSFSQASKDWVKNTSEKLCTLLKKIISSTAAHQHWRVRLELLELAEHLLDTCSQSLGKCVGLLLEALVGAINDEEPIVKKRCEVALKKASKKNQMPVNMENSKCTNSSQTFTDILSENLHSLATSLPRLMRTSDDQNKMFVLNVFLGYLKLLGPLVSVVLNSAVHLERISKALMQVLELDVADVRIVEERGHGGSLETSSGSHHSKHIRRKHFLHFTDEKIFFVLTEICRTFGYYGNVFLLTDLFLDLYRQSSAYRKQAAMVLNEIIRGAAGIAVVANGQRSEGKANVVPLSQEDLKAAVMLVMEEYFSSDHWHLVTVNEETHRDRQDRLLLRPPILLSISNAHADPLQFGTFACASSPTSTVHQLNSNIWQLCIQLEGVACFAQALGDNFRPLLMTSLYPVLEKAGEETLLISQAALDSMWDISKACGYFSLKELINENSDYLLNDISLNLQRLSQHPQAPRVLAVMLNHSDCTLLPLVRDIIQDVLMALDLSYDHTASLFCSVLHALMKALVRWFPMTSNTTKDSMRFKQTSTDKEVFDVRQFLLDYRRQKELAEGIGIEEDDIDELEIPPQAVFEEDDDASGPDVKAELPTHLSITKDVMERCIHLLSDSNLCLRLKVLDVLELCVSVLSEKEDELLPMTHRCWPALVQRLTADDPLAVLRAFRVLCTLSRTCGDFLRRRVSKEILPKLSSSLVHQAPISTKAGPVYTHTLAYKLQLAVLEGLGSLCQSLDLAEADLDVVCEACLPYLSCKQPIRLQQACLSVFHHLIQVDPDSFWLTLNELYCPSSFIPPHPDLQPMRLSGMGRPRDEYSDNVLTLLREEFGQSGDE